MFKRYRVWGEYGPTAHDYIVFYCDAKTPENAVKRAIREFKKSSHWDRIGPDNVHIEEMFKSKA